MKYSNEVKSFVTELTSTRFGKCVNLIKEDVDKLYEVITNLVITQQIRLSYSWNNYEFDNVHIFYTEDLIEFSNMLNTYGIDIGYDILGTTSAMVVTYKFAIKDLMHNDMGDIIVYHIITDGANPVNIIDIRYE